MYQCMHEATIQEVPNVQWKDIDVGQSMEVILTFVQDLKGPGQSTSLTMQQV